MKNGISMKEDKIIEEDNVEEYNGV